MGCSELLVLGFLLNFAHCLEILDRDPNLEIPHNLTAVLGEDAYLSCRYLGEHEILSAQWKRQINSIKSKRLAGFTDGKPFGRSDFSKPASPTNLTVQINVSSVEVEGQYICEFKTEEDDISDSLFLTVVARPDVQILVNSETINGSQYQSVSCSAVGGRPVPQISWSVKGRPPSDYFYTVNVSETAHSNGTSTLSSILRFPTHLQEEDSVICSVQHPTLQNPKLTTARVETYTRPNVTIKAEMVQRGGTEFWVVSCISSGGRPDADISLALNTDEELQREYSTDTDTDTQTSSVLLPVTVYEGRNVTCVFDHPKFTHKVSRVITLPSFYLSGKLGSYRDNFQDPESLELQEGQSDTVISLQVTGNVPHYTVTCKKDDGPLPERVELVGNSSLIVQGPVEHQHAGLYECVFSYHQLNATLTFNVTVKPHHTQPVAPTVRVDLQTEDGYRVIKCSAADAVPAANMSWLLPEGVSGVSWFNFTSHNGSHSVKGVLLLPACTPWELTAVCVINHPAFEEPENRSMTLPHCARPHIAINSSTEWKDGEEYTKVDCFVDSVAPAATITWHAGNGYNSISSVHVSLSEMEVQADGLIRARSSAHFLSSLYSGQNVTCRVEHPSLEAPEKRALQILVHKAPVLSVSVARQEDSHLWLAVCDCRGEGVGTNLAWVLPENAKGQTSLHSTYEGRVIKARLTYQFPLAYHEGQDLTCVYHFENGATEKKTVHIPRYYISSVKVLNHTTPLQSRYSGETIVHRLALKENHHNQRVLLRVEGNVPEYNIDCRRSDGSFVQMDGVAMVFQSALTEQEEGLYICQASFYHHTATVRIQVEVASEDKHIALASMICASSALAILFILAVTLWVCCKRNGRTHYKKQESISALTSLMQEPGSPEVKKPVVTENLKKEDAQLVSYAIVIDIKSTV
ncbi:uncharacterized protein si:ch211-149e23.4 isoform X1 [Etheostoma cragini]|uniref:uncharacterized protein si:ch211-149e23.4 isoform X1 n=1 Tax=Etheostoma cragini TaxID=417921 RepID=UPI00155E3BEB|nr:uncharacterized protein si:ch211-149e23.4 isoform X1 [Etheostoma cragini]